MPGSWIKSRMTSGGLRIYTTTMVRKKSSKHHVREFLETINPRLNKKESVIFIIVVIVIIIVTLLQIWVPTLVTY